MGTIVYIEGKPVDITKYKPGQTTENSDQTSNLQNQSIFSDLSGTNNKTLDYSKASVAPELKDSVDVSGIQKYNDPNYKGSFDEYNDLKSNYEALDEKVYKEGFRFRQENYLSTTTEEKMEYKKLVKECQQAKKKYNESYKEQMKKGDDTIKAQLKADKEAQKNTLIKRQDEFFEKTKQEAIAKNEETKQKFKEVIKDPGAAVKSFGQKVVLTGKYVAEHPADFAASMFDINLSETKDQIQRFKEGKPVDIARCNLNVEDPYSCAMLSGISGVKNTGAVAKSAKAASIASKAGSFDDSLKLLLNNSKFKAMCKGSPKNAEGMLNSYLETMKKAGKSSDDALAYIVKRQGDIDLTYFKNLNDARVFK